MSHVDLMAGPPPTHLPVDPAAEEIAAGEQPAAVVRRHPASPLAAVAGAPRAPCPRERRARRVGALLGVPAPLEPEGRCRAPRLIRGSGAAGPLRRTA